MGRTKGGLNTKIHAVVTARSQAIVIALSSGNEADISLAEELTECLPKDSSLIGDKAYDSCTLRQTAATRILHRRRCERRRWPAEFPTQGRLQNASPGQS